MARVGCSTRTISFDGDRAQDELPIHILMCLPACSVTSLVSDSWWLRGLQLIRLLCPWNSSGKNTGVGSHALLHGPFTFWKSEYLKWKVLEKMACQPELSQIPLWQFRKPSCKRCLSCTRKKGTSLSLKTDGCQEILWAIDPAEFPPLLHWPPQFSPLLQDYPLFLKPGMQYSGLTPSLDLHFLMKSPVSGKTLNIK